MRKWMMLRLPRPDHTPLEAPALPLVVAQARYAGVRIEVSAEVVKGIQARLRRSAGVSLDRVAQLASTDIVIGPGIALPPQMVQGGVQMATADGQWQATVTADWVSLETQSFRSYAEEFAPLLSELIQAVSELLEPVTTVRTGLRFVNVLRPPRLAEQLHDGAADATVWRNWVRDSLVAPYGDERLKEGVVTFAQQMLLEVAPGIRSAVRSGPIDGDEGAFLLDIDSFAEPQLVWDFETVLDSFEDLNHSGVALFQQLVTLEMLTHLRGHTPNALTGLIRDGDEGL